MLQITEIIQRSEQGITRPFICRAEDGALYYVKGAGAGWKALVAEWLAGNLARELDLPVPPFEIVEVPGSLLRHSARDDLGDLGSSPVFASREVTLAEELRFSLLAVVPIELQAMVLLFDCWIGNGDRTLSEHGGNPNVLWTPGDATIHLIDHNLAFENDPLSELKEHHVFRTARAAWTPAFRGEATQRMRAAVAKVPHFWAAMPDEWLEYGGLTLPQVEEILWRYDQDADILWA